MIKNKFRSVALSISKFFVIIICIILIYNNIENNVKFFDFSKKEKYVSLVLIILLSIIVIIFYSVLHFITLKKISNFNLSYKNWLNIFLKSQFLNSIPFLGIFYRAKVLNNLSFTYSNFVIYLFVIKFFFLIFASIFFTLELYYFKINFIIYLIPLIIFGFLLLLFISKYYKKYVIVKKKSIFQYIDIFFVNFFNVKYLSYFFIIFIIIHIFEISIFFLIVDFNNLGLNSITTFFLYITNILIDYFPITPQNFGITELGMAYMSQDLGYNFSDGIVLKINFRFFILISSLLSLICYYLYIKLNKLL